MSKIISCCGMVCSECGSYPVKCPGCYEIKGMAYWLEYVGEDCCPVYHCCVTGKGVSRCGERGTMPCIAVSENNRLIRVSAAVRGALNESRRDSAPPQEARRFQLDSHVVFNRNDSDEWNRFPDPGMTDEEAETIDEQRIGLLRSMGTRSGGGVQ